MTWLAMGTSRESSLMAASSLRPATGESSMVVLPVVRLAISASSAASGKGTSSLKKKRSSWASGRG